MADFAESCVLLNSEQARAHVGSTLGKPVPRATFYRWRQALNLNSPYSLDAVYALAVFGRNIRTFRDSDASKKLTVEVLEKQGL